MVVNEGDYLGGKANTGCNGPDNIARFMDFGSRQNFEVLRSLRFESRQ